MPMKIFKTSEERLAEDWVYEKVAEEIERNDLRKGLWLKASSEAMGDDKKARAIYVKLRVRQFVDELELAEKIEKEQKQAALDEAHRRAAEEEARALAAKNKANIEEADESEKRRRENELLFGFLLFLMICMFIAAIS